MSPSVPGTDANVDMRSASLLPSKWFAKQRRFCSQKSLRRSIANAEHVRRHESPAKEVGQSERSVRLFIFDGGSGGFYDYVNFTITRSMNNFNSYRMRDEIRFGANITRTSFADPIFSKLDVCDISLLCVDFFVK